jgi:hypothetical protein
MTGSALMDFLIAVVGLCIIVYLIFLALDMISPDERFKQVGRYAVGGAALLVFLVAIKGVLFGGGGGLAVTPVGVIEFAIGLIVVMVVLFIIYMVIDRLAPAELATPVKYVIGAIALIALLILAERVLFGGGGAILSGPNPFRLQR